jgi:ABC-type uncharacterized transport system permease subunit
MTLIGHALAMSLYLFAAVYGWRPGRAAVRGQGVPWILAVGAGLHTLGLYGMHLETPPVPLQSLPAALSLIGWLVAAAYLVALFFARLGGIGAWIGLVAAGFTLLAELGLQGGLYASGAGKGSPLWSHAHVLLSTAGFSMLALASLAGLAYLAKRRALKRKVSGPRGPELPSLESLDRAEHVTLTFGFVLLTLGVITGFVWGLGSDRSPWTGHALFLLASWFIYLVPVGLRLIQRQHGPRPARGVVLSFVVLAFSYIGIRVLGSIA